MNKRECIEAAIAGMISERIISIGDCVPSIRKMSGLYNVSTTPVIEAYRSLESYGLIESRPKSSFVVVSNDVSCLPVKLINSPCPAKVLDKRQCISENPLTAGSGETRYKYDFGRLTIESSLAPSEEMSACISRALRLQPELIDVTTPGYDDELLINTISKYMFQYQRIVSRKEICIVNNDITTALTLAIKSCSTPEQTILLTSPCSSVHSYSAALCRRRTVFVRSTPQLGIDLDELERVIAQNDNIACLLIAPHYHVPNGALMSDAAKRRLLEICCRNSIAIIEDDSCGDLYFGAHRPRPIKSISPEHTIYISSFSSSVAPGLRIHWVCPGKYTDILRYYRSNISSAPPAFIQSGFAMYMQSRHFKKHMALIRSSLDKAVSAARGAVYSSFPDGTYAASPEGGYILYVQLPSGIDGTAFFAEAKRRGISLIECEDPISDVCCFAINCSVIAKAPPKLSGIAELGSIACRQLRHALPELRPAVSYGL